MSTRDSDSSNITHSSALRAATTLRSSTENSASTTPIRANKWSAAFPNSTTVTLSQVLALFHCQNFSNASEDEAMFFYHLFFRLCANAKVLAREANGTSDRALHALMESISTFAQIS